MAKSKRTFNKHIKNKCYSIFKMPKSIRTTSINNVQIKLVNQIKFIGVEINSELNWKDHIHTVTNKISPASGIIRRIRYKLTLKAAMLLYDTLIAHHLLYII